MVDEKNSSGVDENTKVIETAKQDIRKEMENTKTDDEKKSLGKKIREELERGQLAAEEVVKDEIEARMRGRSPFKKEEAKQALRSLTRALEAIRQGLPVEYIAQTKEGAVILEKLATQIVETPSTASAIQYYFGDYIFGNKKIIDTQTGKITEDFKTKFNELSKINSIVANKFKETLKKTAETNQIPGLTAQIIEETLRIEDSSDNKKISYKEKEQHAKLFKLINQKIQEAIKNKKIDLNDLNVINDFLFTGEINSQVEEVIEKIGINKDEIKTYSKLTKQLNSEFLEFGIIESYSPSWIDKVREAQKTFSLEGLKEKQLIKINEEGKLVISSENRQKIKDLIKKYYYLAISELHQQPSETFHKLMGEHQDISYYIMMIRQVINTSFEKLEELIPETHDNQGLISFLNDIRKGYQSRILTQAEMFHDVPLYVRDLGSVEKILDFLKFIFPTQLAELFHDDKLYLTIARDEMTMLLRQYLVEKNNEYDGSILSGEYNKKEVYWSQWFKDKYKERLKKRLNEIIESKEEKEYLEENKWKLEMISTYAEAIGIITLIDGEVLSASNPVSHFRNVHPLMSLLSAKHNWSLGRGQYGTGLINKYLLGMKVEMYPKKRSLLKRLFSKKPFNPQAIKEEIDSQVETVGAKIIDNIFNASGLYMQLLSMFNLPNSYNSWDGWRIEQLPKDFNLFVFQILGKDIIKDGKKFTAEDWKEVYDLGFKLYGTSFLWWSIKGALGRLNSEIDQRLRSLGFNDQQIKQIKSERAIENIIETDFDGKKRYVNYVEFEELKLAQRRGELYFRYLRKNPGDFLMILHQVCPEVFSTDNKNDWKTTLLFEFDPSLSDKEVTQKLKKLSKDNQLITDSEIKVFLKKRRVFWERWKDSFNDLSRINKWIRNISMKEEFLSEQQYFDKDKNEFVTKKTFDKKKFIELFTEASSTAYARLKRENEIVREKILYSNISLEEKKKLMRSLRDYLKKEDFAGYEEYWEIFGGENGFFKAMTGLDINNAENYFQVFGGVNTDGKMNVFFNIAHNWFLNNGDINPFSADTPYYEVFKNFKTSGEETLKRTFEGNITTFKEVSSKLGKLEVILLEAAKSGSLEEIKKLHAGIYSTLSGLVGNEYAWRANYILAQIVANFFAEHSLLRDPKTAWLGPLGWLARSLVGRKNVSLSQLLTENPYAHSMDSNALITYFESLRRNNLINPKYDGPWGMDQLNRVFETGTTEFILGDVAPKVLWSIVIFMLLTYIKKAWEENENKKK